MSIDYTKCLCCNASFNFTGFDNGVTTFYCPNLCPCSVELDYSGFSDNMMIVVANKNRSTIILSIEPNTEHWQLHVLNNETWSEVCIGDDVCKVFDFTKGLTSIVKQIELYEFLY